MTRDQRKPHDARAGSRPARRRHLKRAEEDPVRSDLVGAQFEDPAAAAGYAASHEGWGPPARYFHSRLHAVQEALRQVSGGDLVDIGCGPGMFVRRLVDTRRGDFRITALDRSPAMIQAAAARLADVADVRLAEGRAEAMPFPDASFDTAVAMGVLEYCPADRALRELARVTRPGGLVLVTMLNPLSPYRLVEWNVYWPLLRLLGRVEAVLGRPPQRRHGAHKSGIRAVPPSRLRRMMNQAGIQPDKVVHYDLTPLVPPLDRIVRRWTRQWREHPEQTIAHPPRGWLGTAYLVVAHRLDGSTGE